jgi:hypothetical protein
VCSSDFCSGRPVKLYQRYIIPRNPTFVCWDWSNIQKPHICVLGLVKYSETPHLCAGTGQTIFDSQKRQPQTGNTHTRAQIYVCPCAVDFLMERYMTQPPRKAERQLKPSPYSKTPKEIHTGSPLIPSVSKCETCASSSSTYRFNFHDH